MHTAQDFVIRGNKHTFASCAYFTNMSDSILSVVWLSTWENVWRPWWGCYFIVCLTQFGQRLWIRSCGHCSMIHRYDILYYLIYYSMINSQSLLEFKPETRAASKVMKQLFQFAFLNLVDICVQGQGNQRRVDYRRFERGYSHGRPD